MHQHWFIFFRMKKNAKFIKLIRKLRKIFKKLPTSLPASNLQIGRWKTSFWWNAQVFNWKRINFLKSNWSQASKLLHLPALSITQETYHGWWRVLCDWCFLYISKAFVKFWQKGVIIKLKQNGVSSKLLSDL